MNPYGNAAYSRMEGSQFNETGFQPELSNVKLNRSFVDNKPMIQGVMRSILKVDQSGEAHLINSGLTDNEGAKQIAKNLFQFYDRDRTGSLNTVKALPMLMDAYRVFNAALSPQKEDINGFFSTLDVDRDNQVRVQDLENLCVRYLTGSVMDREFKFQSASQSLKPPGLQQSVGLGQSLQGGLGTTQGRFYN